MEYRQFTVKAALELTSPPSWVASIGPCLIAGALAVCCAVVYAFGSGDAVSTSLDGAAAVNNSSDYLAAFSLPGLLSSLAVVLTIRSAACWVLMLLCAVLMQSATNTLNDYQDYKSGLDTVETVLDKTDASIIYNQIDPRHAFKFALILLAGAGVLGIVVVMLSSWWLLILGVVSAAVVVLYSAGPKPISSLPLGEVISGVVMGGIITCATFFAMTLTFSPLVAIVAVVPTLAIAQIMLTNNTCDISRDREVGRHTLPGFMGPKVSRVLNVSFCLISFLLLFGVLYVLGLPAGIIVVIGGFAICFTRIDVLLKGKYDLMNRRTMMQAVVSYSAWLFITAAIALLSGGIVSVIL